MHLRVYDSGGVCMAEQKKRILEMFPIMDRPAPVLEFIKKAREKLGTITKKE